MRQRPGGGERAQIIVSADVTDQANDIRQVEPMVAQTLENLDAVGVEDNVGAFTADAGYFSEDNMNPSKRMIALTQCTSRRAA